MLKQLKEFLNDVIKNNPDYKFIFSHSEWETDFLRFFQSQVNYNITKKSESLGIDIYKGKKSYSLSITNPDQKQILQKLEEAYKFIDKLPEDPDFVDIEADQRKTDENPKTNNIEKLNLEAKIEILKKFSDIASKYNFKTFGTFICNYQCHTVINSNGVEKVSYNSPIMLEIKGVADSNMVTVLESLGGERLENLDFNIAITSFEKKIKAATADVIDVDPDHYEVILAPRCIGEFLSYLGSSIGVASLDRKSSFFEGKQNSKVFPESVTVYDDPHNPSLVNFDYNGEGHKVDKLMVIENGVFKNFFVNTYWGHKTGYDINGNQGSCLVMEEGDKSLDEMISTVKKGIYISSLHYMNFINVKDTSLTGLTRDGTFLIEDGKITKVINNLRFTEKISTVLENITEVENNSYPIPFSTNYGSFAIYSSKMPHVKVSSFHISSSTKTI
jgi:predicted Zn-dependent protease